jgi:hypothetical protein
MTDLFLRHAGWLKLAALVLAILVLLAVSLLLLFGTGQTLHTPRAH